MSFWLVSSPGARKRRLLWADHQLCIQPPNTTSFATAMLMPRASSDADADMGAGADADNAQRRLFMRES